jgi:hypothetical protein
MKKIIRLTESDLTRVVRHIIKEVQTPQNFLNTIIEDFKKLGFTYEQFPKTSVLRKGGLSLIFTGPVLTSVKMATRVSIYNMGSDSLSDKEFAKSFRAYDNSDNMMTAPNAEELGNFKNWVAQLNATTAGTSKETTPFYKYYNDIIKLSKISDKYTNFNATSVKDKAKLVGQEVKKIGQKVISNIRNK